ncbi:ABC transporter ATP-binding protein [Corynebacterium amycolatum]|uniref:ABC transporter ATP-binding protein n=1 Tax=Corynebacterium amycolatum TaxID=43765 RepID=UPI000F7BCB0F|nr:ABC transporter ATP-binding protein [Corynebacterium amycolatum]AYX81371.1 ABC transporter ATP-binding protein [Corynebacterium jeikeium]MDC7116086.1 ABC transporter ATP-binding protein [Corynebacterium amycolatum]
MSQQTQNLSDHVTKPDADSTALLRATDLSVGYRNRTVVSGVNLAIRPGEVHGIIGSNGTGKSSLLRAMAGIVTPSSGQVELLGAPLTKLRAHERATRLAYLPQHTPADAAIDVRTVVALGRYAHHRRRDRFHSSLNSTDHDIVAYALDRVGVTALADRPITGLSGGQRQLVFIAKLLAQQAKVMLFDEPTAALDIGFQLEILELLGELADEGHGIGVVLHDLNLAARSCHRLSVIHNGGLEVTGSAEEVLTPPRIDAIYRISSAVDTDPHTGSVRVTALARARPAD